MFINYCKVGINYSHLRSIVRLIFEVLIELLGDTISELIILHFGHHFSISFVKGLMESVLNL